MTIKVNGEEKTLSVHKITVAELLKLEQVEMPEMVSVQLNGEFVDRADFQTTELRDGDEVDFLYFMGGGA